MSTPTVLRLLLASIIALPLACVPSPAFGQHHARSSRGGGSSHNSGPRGGGRSRSGGRGGFQGGRGHFGGRSLGRGVSAAPRQRSTGSFRRPGAFGSRPQSHSAFFGSRGVGASRPPSAASAPRSWFSQGQTSWASTPRSRSSFNLNRPPYAASAPRSWSGQGRSSWASLSRSTLSFSPNRGPSNFKKSRFVNSALGHSSFSNSRTWSSVPLFGSSRFGSAYQFDSGATNFNREFSFSGGDSSFIPDLFGLALNLGGFGLRSLTLLGSAGLGGFGVPGLGLLATGLAGIPLDAGLESRPWGPDSPFYSTQNLTGEIRCKVVAC